MGTWIAHLRIAENLLPQLPRMDEVAFIYGNLAPDSGLPNENWKTFDPPKEITHFLQSNEDEDSIRDLLFYRNYLSPIDPSSNRIKYSFCLGYYFHLLVDILWSKKIGTTTIEAFNNEIMVNPGKAWETIKRDWYGLDILYVHRNPECIFNRLMVNTTNPTVQLPYLLQTGFDHQMNYIRKLYSNPDPEWFIPRRFPYLNENTMDRFVKESTLIISNIWKNKDRLLASQIANSALESVNENELSSYAMPLGDKK